MFAGPNGSGKSTLINDIRKSYNIGYFINADNIEKALNTSSFINCEEYLPVGISQEEWLYFVQNIEKEKVQKESLQKISIVENIMVSHEEIDSYTAASIADFFRKTLIKQETTFSFETVMSHISKVNFLQQTRNAGFKTYLYYISTQDPQINIERVSLRVLKGGHNVDKEKIEARYFRSMELLSQAFLIADKAYIFDSTDLNSNLLLLEKKEDTVAIHQNEVPEWVKIYLLDKI